MVGRLGDLDAFAGRFVSCRAFEQACQLELLDKLGARLYRRPLAAADRDALMPLFDRAKADGGTFLDAVTMVVEVMLQSPRFLYRVEDHSPPPTQIATRPLDGFELASRLSYLIWGSAPDDALYQAAAGGDLTSEAGLATQLDRMLDTDRARQHSRAFVDGWLDLGRLEQLDSPLSAEMRRETEALFEQIAWIEGRPLTDLLTAEVTFAAPALATHYGLGGTPDGARYALTAADGRLGLLTQAAVLSAGGPGASLTHRGLFLREKLMCDRVNDPPPGVNNARPVPEPGRSERYYSEQRVETRPCGDCHSKMDPLGYPFTVFDGLGARRDVDSQGNELTTDGVFAGLYQEGGGDRYADAREFAALLAADARVRECMILKPARFALGRSIDRADGCTLAAVRSAVERDGLTYRTIVRAIALQPSFRQTRGE